MKSRLVVAFITFATLASLSIPVRLAAQHGQSAQICNQNALDGRVNWPSIFSPVPLQPPTAVEMDRFLGSRYGSWMDLEHRTNAAPGTLLTVSSGGTPSTVSLFPTILTFYFPPLFPKKCLPSPNPLHVTLKNLGPSALQITGITISGPFSQTNTCGTTLGVGNSCIITVTWKKITGGGLLSIIDNGVGSPQQVRLYGATNVCPFV